MAKMTEKEIEKDPHFYGFNILSGQSSSKRRNEGGEKVIVWRRYGELGTVEQAGCFEMDR